MDVWSADRYLYLQGNKIAAIGADILPLGLRNLFLNDNKMTAIGTGVLPPSIT